MKKTLNVYVSRFVLILVFKNLKNLKICRLYVCFSVCVCVEGRIGKKDVVYFERRVFTV